MFKNLVIIGSGNVAWHLSKALEDFINVRLIISRNEHSGKELAQKYNAEYSNIFEKINEDDLVLVCVQDSEIDNLLKSLDSKIMIAITSGSFDIQKAHNFKNIATFYPLQTFTKNRKLDYTEIPFLLESNNKVFLQEMYDLAWKVSSKVEFMNVDQRKTVHLAAVFANNFSNHLFYQSAEILKLKSIDFELMTPLIKETILKALAENPEFAQTGPARRNDIELMENQEKMLNLYQKEIYLSISKSIQNTYKK